MSLMASEVRCRLLMSARRSTSTLMVARLYPRNTGEPEPNGCWSARLVQGAVRQVSRSRLIRLP
jgi:hypothetical protein